MLPNTNSSSPTTLEGSSSPFFHSPWDFLYDVDEELFMSHLLSQHHSLSMNNAPVTTAPDGEKEQVYVANGDDLPTATRANMVTEGALKAKKRKHGIALPKKQKQQREKKKIQSPNKVKTGRKDRHSKICTAQGIRDRRMRLSLNVARKFFDLQDMLGFDKASKTIEWLLINCKDAIQDLIQTAACNNKHICISASEESEVESQAKEMETIRQAGEEEPLACRKRKRKSCKVITNHLAKESRDKARARARERTRDKLMMIRGLDPKENTQSTESKHHHQLHAGVEDSGNSSPQADLFEEPQASVAVLDELLGITRSSSSSSTFSYNCPDFAAALSGPNYSNEFPGFLPTQKGMEEARIEPAAGCYTMTSKKPPLGNVQVQNTPNAMFRTTLNAPKSDKLPSTYPRSTFPDGGQWNPSSTFVRSPTTLDQENPFPNSILMTRTSNALEGVFTATSSNASFQSHFLGNYFL